MKDLIGGAFFFLLAGSWLWQANDIRNPGFDELGPAFVPRLVLVPILLLAIWQMAAGLRQFRTDPEGWPSRTPSGAMLRSFARPIGLLLLLVAFTWVLTAQAVRFEIAGAVFVLFSGIVLAGWRDRRLLAWIVAVSLTIPPVVGYVFKSFLFVNLP